MNPALKKFHRLTGIVIASFLLLHVANHLFALGGPSLHISVMKFLRHIYRFPPIEFLLLACVIFQIISGIWLAFKKGFLRQPFYAVVQVLSGLYLSFFMIYHVRAVLLGRYQWKVDTNFYFAAGVAVRYPEKLFFIPYYTLSLLCVFLHIACVHYTKRLEQFNSSNIKISDTKFQIKYKKEALGICIAGCVITFLIMISFSGVLYNI